MILVKRYHNGQYIYYICGNKETNTLIDVRTLTAEEKARLKERDRQKKRRSYATNRAMTDKYYYFGTLSVDKDSPIVLDFAQLLTCGKKFLTTQGVKYFLALQNYSIYSEHRDKYHLHFLSDKPVDLSYWKDFVGKDADIANCYCEPIRVNQFACVRYILRDIGRIPKGKHAFACNAKAAKSEFYVIDEDTLSLVYTNATSDCTDFIDNLTDEISGVIPDDKETALKTKEEKNNNCSFTLDRGDKSPLSSEVDVDFQEDDDPYDFWQSIFDHDYSVIPYDPYDLPIALMYPFPWE